MQRKDEEPHSREAGVPLGPRVPPASPVTHATPSADERSEGPKTEGPRATEELQVGVEDSSSSSGDDWERGRVTQPLETLTITKEPSSIIYSCRVGVVLASTNKPRNRSRRRKGRKQWRYCSRVRDACQGSTTSHLSNKRSRSLR